MRHIVCYIVFFFGSYGMLAAQSFTYKITWRGDSIGYLRADRDTNGSFITYELVSKTSFSFLLSYSMLTEYHSVYKDGQLLTASSNNFVNDKKKDYSKIKYLEDAYQIEVNKDFREEVLEINESISTLYFKPPVKNMIFSERHGILCQIEKSGTNAYDLVKPDDRINTYYYKNGICEKVLINLALATIELQKIN